MDNAGVNRLFACLPAFEVDEVVDADEADRHAWPHTGHAASRGSWSSRTNTCGVHLQPVSQGTVPVMGADPSSDPSAS